MGYKFNVFTGKLDIAGLSSVAGGDHSTLSNLSYATAGHTGFEPTVTKGNLTEATSSVLSITGGNGAIIGSGVTIQVAQATTTTAGYLSATDWNTFNGKQDALTFGIADDNAVEIDSSTVASGEYAKFTANGLESKSYAEVKTDLSLNLVENTALSTWAGTTNVVTVGTITTGTWNGTTIAIANGGTGQTTQQAAIDALTNVSAATNEHVLTKDTATGNAVFKAGGSGAPVDATYITQTPNATLTNEQALSALATGILKNTTTTGVLSIAVAGTDYENALTFSSPLVRSTNTISIPDAQADGSTKGAAAFNANDFNDAVGVISIDYTNGQQASAGAIGFLNTADWSTFNAKAPPNASYLTATAEAGLSAEVNLGALTTGLLKITVAAGVATPSTAIAGTDYDNYWTRTGTVLTARTAGDDLNITGDIRNLADNKKHYWGAGNDCYIEYDGTDMLVNPKSVGSGIMKVAGEIEAALDINVSTAGYGYQLGGVDVLNDYTQTGGSNCLWVGHNAGANAISGTGTPIRCAAVGKEALNAITTATDVYAAGYRAGYALTQGTGCVLIGSSAGLAITTGTHNLCVGFEAGASLTTQSQNVLFGYRAGKLLTDSDNVFIGYLSGHQATTALGNTGIGSGTFALLTTGDSNLGLGGGAGVNITTGSSNTIIGYQGGGGITTGTGNVIIGALSGTGPSFTTNTTDRLFIGQGTTDSPLVDGSFVPGALANPRIRFWGDVDAPDDYRHYFGTARDVSIRWDSANSEWTFKLDEQTPAGSDLVIDSADDAHTLRLKNSAKVYQLEYKGWAELEPDETGWGSITSPSKINWINDGIGSVGITGAVFPPRQDSHLYGSTKLSGQYEENTDIIPMVNWSPLDPLNANVVWELEWTAQIPGAAFPFTIVSRIVVPTGGVQYLLNEDAFDPIPGNLIRYVIDFRLSRIGTDPEDSYVDQGVILHGLAFYNSVDTIGSRTQLTK